MSPTSATTNLAVALAACALSGCALSDPYQRQTEPSRTSASPAPAERSEPPDASADEGPSRPVPLTTPPQRTSTARDAAERFALLWTNWTWRTLPHQTTALADLATGKLHRDLIAAAQATRRNGQITVTQEQHRGRIVATDLQGSTRSPRIVVVTREQAIQNGRVADQTPTYRIYLARAIRGRDRWLITFWRPIPAGA